MRNGNFQKVREICEELHKIYGKGLRRKHVMKAATEAGVPESTASQLWQEWRIKNGM